MHDPILITGCARSGTSMTAGIINICGAFGGEMFGPNRFNQKGMFENQDIRTNIDKPYMSKIGADPNGQKPLPNNRQVFEVSQPEIDHLRESVIKSITSQGYVDGQWFYKGHRLCVTWYIWHKAFPNAKWVIVKRDHAGIIRSCIKTRFMNAYRDAAGWQSWIDVHEQRFKEMKIAGLNTFEFWPSEMTEGDFTSAQQLINWLGLKWDKGLCLAFIDPKLYAQY